MSFKFLIAFGIGLGVYVLVVLAIYVVKKIKSKHNEKIGINQDNDIKK